MNEALEFVKVNAKAVVVFVVGVILNAVMAVVNGQVPWPTTLKEWGQYLGTSLVAALAVWATGNKLTEKQIVNGADQQGITVVQPAAAQATAEAAAAAVNVGNEFPDRYGHTDTEETAE